MPLTPFAPDSPMKTLQALLSVVPPLTPVPDLRFATGHTENASDGNGRIRPPSTAFDVFLGLFARPDHAAARRFPKLLPRTPARPGGPGRPQDRAMPRRRVVS
ncbi:hypothetical protein CMUS01_05078 [Colletotrichum musicola]|uniref:Uncharacterized protein n=1 Tax=Colletotrichum musicola TaxID=2175873 RepID=A0A8H6KU78_9PEZI|nr:hypothetical protein CMUS01_05078 [Colletotrichum musicola]